MTQSASPVILIVENEFLIRIATAEAIRDVGFEVVEAANADDAIAVLESRRDIRVVFTEVHLRGSMDGVKLAHAIRDRWPPVRIITTSGRLTLKELDLPAGSIFFPKPYSAGDIAWTLRALTG